MELQCTAQRACRLLSLLRRELGLSTSLIRRLKYQNALFVNGAAAHTDHPVAPGDEILVRLEEGAPDFPSEDGPLSILYEDAAFLALDKPAGLMVHPTFRRTTGTLANRVLGYYARTGQACAVHPVSRLDRDTFGVVLLAKNAHVHALCCGLLKAGGFCKTYRAAVFGAPADGAGVITLPIARRPGGSLLREVRPDGQAAKTEYRVLARRDGLGLLELHPVTGRTHQLRVHCAASGFPVLGDPQYGSADCLARSARLGLTGQQLCASSVAFCHPLTGAPVRIVSRQTVFWPDRQDFSF